MKPRVETLSNSALTPRQTGPTVNDQNAKLKKPVRLLAVMLGVGAVSAFSQAPIARHFSAGKPILQTDPFNPAQVNERSAVFYQHYGNDTRRGSLDNRSARKWYLAMEAEIPNKLNVSAPLAQQAEVAYQRRNEIRSEARFLMNDRIKADRLAFEEPNIEWQQLLNKTQTKLAEPRPKSAPASAPKVASLIAPPSALTHLSPLMGHRF